MDAIVLAGGRARRLGGVDKATLEIRGHRLLDRVLDALAAADTVVVVGPRRQLNRPVIWTREDPPGQGPAAALRAGLAYIRSLWVAVAAVDHPFLSAATYERLGSGAEGRDGAIAVDADGIEQYLVAVYAVEPLRAALRGRRSIKNAISALDLARIADARASFDIDTETDLMEAESNVRRLG
jgi:molybdopterin-guanine dinucleotide biosynthesis protein A